MLGGAKCLKKNKTLLNSQDIVIFTETCILNAFALKTHRKQTWINNDL